MKHSTAMKVPGQLRAARIMPFPEPLLNTIEWRIQADDRQFPSAEGKPIAHHLRWVFKDPARMNFQTPTSR